MIVYSAFELRAVTDCFWASQLRNRSMVYYLTMTDKQSAQKKTDESCSSLIAERGANTRPACYRANVTWDY